MRPFNWTFEFDAASIMGWLRWRRREKDMDTSKIPALIPTARPDKVPDPFGPKEQFFLDLASMPEPMLRMYHFLELVPDDEVKQRLAIANGTNYMREADDLGICTSASKVIDGRTVVVYGPTEAAKTFWKDCAADGKSPKETLDSWVTLNKLMDSINTGSSHEEPEKA